MKILLLITIVGLVTSAKIQHQLSTVSNYMTIINKMMLLNYLPSSKQIDNCFTVDQKKKVQQFLKQITYIGASAGTSQLKKLPITIRNNLKTKLSNESYGCLFSTRDLKLLLDKFYTNNIDNVFAEYVESKYLLMHKYFIDLRNFYDDNQYEIYASLLNQLLIQVFKKKQIINDPWSIQIDQLQNYHDDYFGITVSNGMIGAVSSKKPFTVSQTVLAGAYDIFGRGRVDNLLQTFPALSIDVEYNYYNIAGDPYNYQQKLNLNTGQFQGSFSSYECSVKYSYLALKNLPFAFLTVIQLDIHTNGQIKIILNHQSPSYLNNVNKLFQSIDSKQLFNIIHSKATTKSNNQDLVAASAFFNIGIANKIIHQDWDSNRHFLKMSANLTKGNKYKISIITVLMSSQHHSDPQNQAIRMVIRALSIGSQQLINQHRQRWDQLWKSDIEIKGNDQDQKNVRIMLYHCYSFISQDKILGVSPMGLSGLGYNGHIFWDMDIWIYPAILALHPNMAKTLIEYRYERLRQAKNNAFINGYKGAMFPWQSSKEGVQQTPVWALSGPLQHHISGCVALAAWNYYAVTQDIQWLKQNGFDILKQVSDFWVSRVVQIDGQYHIKNVVGADEWAQNIDDDAFTNGIAKQILRLTNVAAQKLGYKINETYKDIGDKIVILKNEDNVTREHSTYKGENIKQADVNLLAYPLSIITDATQIRKDLQYYQIRIPNEGTPAMTYSIFTLLYARMKDKINSYKYFKQSHVSYLKKPFNVFAQTKFGTNPYFLTGAGGVIQSLIYGFGGYVITDDGLVKNNQTLPSQWTQLNIKGIKYINT